MPDLVAPEKIPKPWEESKPLYPHKYQVLVIAFLLAVWLHVLFFGLWQIHGWQLVFLEDDNQDLPTIEVSLNLSPPEAAALLSPDASAGALTHDSGGRPEAPITPEALEKLAALALEETALAQASPESFGNLSEPAQEEAAPPGGPVADDSFEMLDQLPPQLKSYSTATEKKIRDHWITPPNVYKNARLVVDVTIDKKGTLTRIFIKESSGDAILDNAALEAIKAAAPFDAFPPSMEHLAKYTYEIILEYKIKPAKTNPARRGKKRSGRR